MRKNFLKLVVVGIAFVTLVGATFFARGELRALTELSRDLRTVYAQASENGSVYSNSYSGFSQSKQMETCLSMQLSIVSALFPTENRAAVANACLQRADEIIAVSPAESLAYVAKGASLANLRDYAAARESLAIARQIAPNEGWQAALRSQLAFYIDRFDDSYLDESDADDLRLMLQGYQQLDVLVALYNRNTARQPFIVAALENEPGDLQRRFLNRLRSTITN